MRLGFPGRIYGLRGGTEESEAGHLGKWLAHTMDVVRYLEHHAVPFYRILPPAIKSSHDYECELRGQAGLLALVAQEITGANLRISAHMPASLVLNARDETMAAVALDWLVWVSHLLQLLAGEADSVIVVHLGGRYGNVHLAIDRFCKCYERMPERVRRVISLENDDRRISFGDALVVHERTGIPIVLDNLHLNVLNPKSIPLKTALDQAIASWPDGRVAKLHYCDPRTEARGLGSLRLKIPSWTEHSDFVNPFAFAAFTRLVQQIGEADVMLEAKARDLAWLKLRQDLERFAPDTLVCLQNSS